MRQEGAAVLRPDLDPLNDYPFARLNDMLDPIQPLDNRPPVAFSIGEPQNQPPALLAETIAAHADQWNRYPQPNGDVEFRQTICDWLCRRFSLPEGLLDQERNVLPVPGTREPLFMMGLLAIPDAKGGGTPTVLMPNPFYHVYRGAAFAGHAEPVYLPALAENNFLPDLDTLTPEMLDRCAIFYLCTPSNPQGTVADLDYLKRAVSLARAHDFLLIIDECYSEIYAAAPPPGGLQACAELGGSLDNVIVFHSLSKRSSAPGLRSGFIAGDGAILARYRQLITFGGSPTPIPILRAATALWREESHVEANRAYYRENYAIATEVLQGRFGFNTPEAGFFLWLDVGDGLAAAKHIWRQAAIKTLPGGFMSRTDPDGLNPGERYLRVALVYDAETTRAGLTRLAEVLEAR
jgi:N-succinyldiaminopimelate aminotransferase